MKTAAKIFLILTYVISFAWVILAILEFVTNTSPLIPVMRIVMAVLAAVICTLALIKLKKAKSKAEIHLMSIMTLLFGNFLAGIFMLCLSDKDLDPEYYSRAASYGMPPQNPYGSPYGNPYGTPYGNPYGNPYGAPPPTHGGAPYGGTPYANPYASPYDNPANSLGHKPIVPTPDTEKAETPLEKDETTTVPEHNDKEE